LIVRAVPAARSTSATIVSFSLCFVLRALEMETKPEDVLAEIERLRRLDHPRRR